MAQWGPTITYKDAQFMTHYFGDGNNPFAPLSRTFVLDRVILANMPLGMDRKQGHRLEAELSEALAGKTLPEVDDFLIRKT